MYQYAATAVLLLHLGFIGLVLCGGLAVHRWPRLAWLHIPALTWGFLVEAAGWYCPLTDLENYLLHQAGNQGYSGDFLSRILLDILYPPTLTRSVQWGLAAVVLAVNTAVYAWVWKRRRAGKQHRVHADM